MRVRNMLKQAIAATLLLTLITPSLWAQQAGGQSGQELVSQVYELTRQAKTLPELVDVVERCERARTQQLSKEQRDYLYRLTAWAYNKRGELYADKAAALQKSKDPRQAKELDALALSDFEKAVQYDPERWKAVHNRGVSFAMVGKYKEAVQDFARTIELNSKYVNAWFNRAEIYYEMGEYSKAVNDYDRVLQLAKDDVDAFTNRGHAFFQLRRMDSAIKDYNEALRLQPNRADSFTNRGDAFMALGEWAKAAKDYQTAIEVDSNSGRAYQSIAWQMATCPDDTFRAVSERDKTTAVRAAQQAISLDGASTDYKYLDTLAAALANAGRFDEARTNLSEAIQLAPESEVPLLRKRYRQYEQNQPYRQQLRTAFRSDADGEKTR